MATLERVREADPGPPPEVSPAKAPRRRGVFASVLQILGGFFLWAGSTALTMAAVLMVWLAGVIAELPDPEAAREPPVRPSVVYLDANGEEIARRGPVVAPPIALGELPPYLIDAVLAVEDRRFYEHPGVDAFGLARAAWANLRAGRVVQGGSTITQQLAKNLFLDSDRTLMRKVQEALLAVWLERRFSKDEILELYLNSVYFGAGAWGVEAAAQRYFGRSAAEVSLAEAAILAGLLKAPSRYAPTSDVARAEERAMVVLNVMLETGAVTQEDYARALAEPVRVQLTADPGFAGHFVDWVAPRVRALAGAGADDALVVHTTLSLAMQDAAERAVDSELNAETLARGASEAALIAVDGDGAVRAMVGGRNYRLSQFNRATQARRQPGSAFKAFVYAAALEAGLSPWDIREDAVIRLGDWEPANYRDEFLGEVTLMTAFARSLNTVAVRVAEEIGRDRVIRMARRMGVQSHLSGTRSLALGAHEVTLDEMTAAYAPFANGGFAVEAYGVLEIRTVEGNVLWTRPQPVSRRVISDRARRFMNEMLARVVEEGTGRAAALPDRAAGGKTGTTNDFRDAWFVGFIPGFVAGVWVGDDDFAAMDRIVGGGPPARIWRAFMMEAVANAPVRDLDRPPRPPEIGVVDVAEAPTEPLIEPGEPSDVDRRALDALLDRILAGGG